MDWPQLLIELRDCGLTQDFIASAVGINQATVSDLFTGRTKNPSFETGEKLRALHKAEQRKARRRNDAKVA